MKLPAKQKRGGKRRRSPSPRGHVEGCDNPAFQASMLEVAVGDDANTSVSGVTAESPPPLPPPRYILHCIERIWSQLKSIIISFRSGEKYFLLLAKSEVSLKCSLD